MKKSFKKAGAAVLSMSMLLSMGAVTLPVYADETIGNSTTKGTYAPAQVEITIAKAGTGVNGGNANGTGTTSNQNDTTHSYDYLDDVSNATVNLYRVATLTGSGWKWDSAIETLIEDANPDVVSDFDKLLEKNDDDESTTSAVDLQSLASKLERIVTDLNNSSAGSVPSLASATVTKDGDGYTTAVLPIDDALFGGNTQNVNGYYLITADTNVAGTVMQPVLVHLKNGLIDGKAYITKLSLKGTNIDIDKTIQKVETRVDANDTAKTTDAAVDDRILTDTGDITNEKKAVVGRDDIVTYQIEAGVPKYDPLLTETEINAYTITDTPDDGINVIGFEDTTNGYQTPKNTPSVVGGTIAGNNKIRVYYSDDENLVLPDGKLLNGESAGDDDPRDILLNEGYDYTIIQQIAPQNASDKTTGANGAGFVVNITGLQLRGKRTNSGGDIELNPNSALYTAADGETPASSKTMENGHIIVVFEADITEEINTTYTANTQTLEPDAAIGDQNFTYDALEVAEATFIDSTTNTKDRAKIAEYAAKFDAAYTGEDNAAKLKIIKDIIKVRVDLVEEAIEASKYNTDASNIAEFEAFTDEPWHEATDEELKAYAMKALETLQGLVDVRNAAVQGSIDSDEASNGADNTATLKYGNKYATGKNDVEKSSDTTVYSVNLDLTKVVIDNNIKSISEDDTTKKIYWKKTTPANDHDSSNANNLTTDKEEAEKDGGNIVYVDKTTATNWTSNPGQAKTQATYVYLHQKDTDGTNVTEGSAKSKYTLNPSDAYYKTRTDGFNDSAYDNSGTYTQFNNKSPVMIAAPTVYTGDPAALKTEYTWAEFQTALENGEIDLTATTVLTSQAIHITDAPIYVTDIANFKEDSTANGVTSLDIDDAAKDNGSTYRITVEGQVTTDERLAKKVDGKVVYIDAYAGNAFVNNGYALDEGIAGAAAVGAPNSTPFYGTLDPNRAYKDANGKYWYYSEKGLMAPADPADVGGTAPLYDATNPYIKMETTGKSIGDAIDDADRTDDAQLALRDGGTPVQATRTDDNGNEVLLYVQKENMYDDDIQHNPVQGAVFELIEIHDAAEEVTAVSPVTTDTSSDKTHSRGYAITTSAGKLVMLEPVTNAAGNVITYDTEAAARAQLTDLSSHTGDDAGKILAGDNVYVGEVDDNGTTKYVVYKATANNAWTDLSKGTYQIKELYAPTGYKKWDAGTDVTFTIGSTLDEDGNHYGKFTGSSESDVFLGKDGENKASATNPAEFALTNTTVTINGTTYSGTVLQNEILNEYNDALPATGGMGTVLFTVGGIAVVLMAGALFVVYMKKRNTEEEE